MLCNRYSENVFQESIIDRTEGVCTEGETIMNMRFVDDTTIMVDISIVC